MFELLWAQGVLHKDRAAKLWCEYASNLTNTKWHYLKVRQRDFTSLEPDNFADLSVLGDQETIGA